MIPNPHPPSQDKLLLLEFHELVPRNAHGVSLDSFLLPLLPFWLFQHCTGHSPGWDAARMWFQTIIHRDGKTRQHFWWSSGSRQMKVWFKIPKYPKCSAVLTSVPAWLKAVASQGLLRNSGTYSHCWTGVILIIFFPLCLVTGAHNLPCYVYQESRDNCRSSAAGSQ